MLLDQSSSSQGTSSFGDGQEEVEVDEAEGETAVGLHLNIRVYLLHLHCLNVMYKNSTFYASASNYRQRHCVFSECMHLAVRVCISEHLGMHLEKFVSRISYKPNWLMM